MSTTALRDRQSGFTLLEMLVALVVLGFLMVGLTAGIQTSLRVHWAQSERLTQTANLDAATRLLHKLLTRLPVVPEGGRLIATRSGTAFQGEADRLSFVGRMPSGLGTDRLAEMTIEVRNGRLLLLWQPRLHARPLAAPAPLHETELLAGVRRLDLAYWGSPGSGQPAAWQSRWERPQAPELVRLHLAFAPGDPRHWPDLIAAPQL